jgi:hypothetical protein
MAINEEAVTLAAREFVASRPDFAEYNLVENTNRMAARIVHTWSESGLENSACWEIVFGELKDSLVKNPNYVVPDFARRANAMSVEEMKRAYKSEVGFAEMWDRLARQEIPAEAISNDPWAGLTGDAYNKMSEAERVHLLNSDFNVRENVRRIKGGFGNG